MCLGESSTATCHDSDCASLQSVYTGASKEAEVKLIDSDDDLQLCTWYKSKCSLFMEGNDQARTIQAVRDHDTSQHIDIRVLDQKP